MSSKRRFSDDRVAGILGLAFDADDGHKRITRGKNFLLAGGSDQTHGLMRETIIKVTEQLDARGQSLADVTVNGLRDLINDALPWPEGQTFLSAVQRRADVWIYVTGKNACPTSKCPLSLNPALSQPRPTSQFQSSPAN